MTISHISFLNATNLCQNTRISSDVVFFVKTIHLRRTQKAYKVCRYRKINGYNHNNNTKYCNESSFAQITCCSLMAWKKVGNEISVKLEFLLLQKNVCVVASEKKRTLSPTTYMQSKWCKVHFDVRSNALVTIGFFALLHDLLLGRKDLLRYAK